MNRTQARPMFLDIDLESAQGHALLDSVATRYGPWVTQAAKLTSRMFLLRSPWAPGLRFVGAEAKQRIPGETGSTLLSVSLSGSGEDIEEAFVCCLGEGIDRLAQIERPGDVVQTANLTTMTGCCSPAAAAVIEPAAAAQRIRADALLAWVSGEPWDVVRGLKAENSTLLPADWCLHRAKDHTILAPLAPLSVGVAAGPTFEWAASRAVLELIERDAAALWWMGGRRGKAIPLDQPGLSEIVTLVAALRQHTNDRVSWMLDITSDIGIPVVAALSCGRDGRQLAYGLAARPSIKQAMRAAFLELCQTELGIMIAAAKCAEFGEGQLDATDRCHLQRSEIAANDCDLFQAEGFSLENALESELELSPILGALQRRGIEVVFVNLSRPELAIPTVRAVAPGLQLMPSSFVTDRLRQEIVRSGGGALHMRGMQLMQ